MSYFQETDGLSVIDRGISLAGQGLEKEREREFGEAYKLYNGALQAYYQGT